MPGAKGGEQYVIPDKLPEPATFKKALAPLETGKPKLKDAKKEPKKEAKKPAREEPKEKAPTGMIKRATSDGHKFWIYVPEDYDPNISQALLVWFHPPGKHKDDDADAFADLWSDFCKDNNIILVQPISDSDNGWVASDTDFVVEAIRDVLRQYTIDKDRIVAHGLGVGGQMALYLGFHSRDLIRGVATTGAVPANIKENQAGQRLAFYLAGGDRDPLIKSIADSRTRLAEHRFPVFFREIPNRGREYLDEPLLVELARWIDSLDRQ
jgi:serine protease Do